MPGGALELIEAGALDGVTRIFGLHCDPSLDVGQVGLREGPLTGAADALDVRLTRQRRAHLAPAPDRGPHLRARQAGHRAARRAVPPARPPRRASAWSGGWSRPARATNVIPATGRVGRHRPDARRGRLGRRRGARPRADRPDRRAVRRRRGGHLRRAACRRWSTSTAPPSCSAGPSSACSARTAHVATTQSLGGEDFALVPREVPGAMGRLGTRTPGRPDVRPPPGRPARRRAGHRRSAPGCSRAAALTTIATRLVTDAITTSAIDVRPYAQPPRSA